jgi:cytoskeletal protein RodZ
MLPFSRHFRVMTIEGLGKKFQDARRTRNLTLDEAARMTKIRPARLAEIEADDFSQFPSLAYAKGFLLIYGKFLDVDVTPYLDAFEDSERVTVDGYSYLQEHQPPKPVSAPAVPRRPRRPVATRGRDRISPMPLIVGIIVLIVGFSVMKLLLNVRRLAPGHAETTAQVSPATSSVAASKPAPAASAPGNVASAPSIAPTVSAAPTVAPAAIAAAAVVPDHPEVRKAKPVTKEELSKAQEPSNSPPAESGEQNRVAIRPLKRTYVRVTVGDEKGKPAFERWVSPTDPPVEFRGKHVSIRVLDPDAVKITKNGKALEDDDADVTLN